MTVSIHQAMQDAAKTQPHVVPMAQANTRVEIVLPPAAPKAVAAHPAAPAPAPTPAPAVAPALQAQAQTLANSPGGTALPGIDPMDFVRANRIHIKNGSLFVDPYLVLHPRELAPENEPALRQKLARTYSVNSPSFFDSKARTQIAVNLGALVPVSARAKHSKLMESIQQFNAEIETGTDAELEKQLAAKHAPFAAIVEHAVTHPAEDPVGLEQLQNSIAVFLLLREKLTQNGYLNPLTDYVERARTPDQVLSCLAEKVGITPLAFREAALRGGIEGIGAVLGVDPAYVAEARTIAAQAAKQDFSYNLIEHWHLGRQVAGIAAPLDQKLRVGMEQRINTNIAKFREQVHYQFTTPEPIQREERRIAQSLSLLEPVQRALLFKLGYEISYSPEFTADDIAFYKGVHGLNRRAGNDLRDPFGTYHIYLSGHGDLEASMRTLCHECAHILWPDLFLPDEIKVIDKLAASDQQRFARFQNMLDAHYPEFEALFNAYKAGNPQQKSDVIAAANQQFAAYDFHAEGLFPYLRDARGFQFAVKHMHDTLDIEGERYAKSGYNSPEERFREVISRFAELTQVRYLGEPEFLQFLAPGLNQIWEAHYLPHLAKLHEGLEKGHLTSVYPRQAAAAVAQEGQTVFGATGAPITLPKVEQRPGQPSVAAAVDMAHPCILDGTPDSEVAADGSINFGTVNAMEALKQMGISPN